MINGSSDSLTSQIHPGTQITIPVLITDTGFYMTLGYLMLNIDHTLVIARHTNPDQKIMMIQLLSVSCNEQRKQEAAVLG